MALIVKRVSDDMYTASATPPDVKEAWSSEEPLSTERLIQELLARGAHQIDVADAIHDQEPVVKRLSADHYRMTREIALHIHMPSLMNEPVQVVLMDWNIGNRTASVVATADGTASLYFSNGGGFIGGSQRYPAIREAALDAIQTAAKLLPLFEQTETTDLPTRGEVAFYLNTKTGTFRATATEEQLRVGKSAIGPLGGAMQKIVTEYRLRSEPEERQQA